MTNSWQPCSDRFLLRWKTTQPNPPTSYFTSHLIFSCFSPFNCYLSVILYLDYGDYPKMCRVCLCLINKHSVNLLCVWILLRWKSLFDWHWKQTMSCCRLTPRSQTMGSHSSPHSAHSQPIRALHPTGHPKSSVARPILFRYFTSLN